MPCLYCGNNKITYRCKTCRSEFCAEHSISTESYYCKKHKVDYSKEKAKEFDYKCTVFNHSVCPSCHSLLKLDRLPGDSYYLKCTNCSWNSYANEPKIHYITKKLVIKEGMSLNLLGRPDLCMQRLKKNPGVNICPNCLVQFLSNAGTTSFGTIKNMFNVNSEQIVKILNKLKLEKRIYGFIDTKGQLFINIPFDVRDSVYSSISKEGHVQIADLSKKLEISTKNSIEFMYDLLKEYKIHGAFDLKKENYFTKDFIDKWLIDTINKEGRISIAKLSNKLQLSNEIVKHYIMELLKKQQLSAYFADSGKEIITHTKLEEEVNSYAQLNGSFKLSDGAIHLKIAVELIRKTLFKLIKEKRLRGIFTQKREFVTEEALSERIKNITKAYKTIKLRELARKLGITEARVEEILAALIAKGAIRGFINMNNREFEADTRQPISIPAQGVTTAQPLENDESGIEILREYDFVGGQLHFKVVVRNNSAMAIHDIKVILDVPTSYRKTSDIITVNVIDPHNSRGVDFYLEPQECGISTIGGTVIYKDAMGKPHSIHVRPKDVQIKCPLVIKTLDTIEDIQATIQTLPSDARAFMIADLDPQLAYRAAFRAITNFDTRNVTSLELPEGDSYRAEAWFSSEAKVTGGRVITRISVNGQNQSLEIRVWCNDAGQLTGFLAKIIELLFLEINLVRKVKAEARQKTLDAMSITQNLITASDYCAVGYIAKEILLKLEDTLARLIRFVNEDDPTITKLNYWIKTLSLYGDDEKIRQEDAEKLMTDIEGFQSTLARSIEPNI